VYLAIILTEYTLEGRTIEELNTKFKGRFSESKWETYTELTEERMDELKKLFPFMDKKEGDKTGDDVAVPVEEVPIGGDDDEEEKVEDQPEELMPVENVEPVEGDYDDEPVEGGEEPPDCVQEAVVEEEAPPEEAPVEAEPEPVVEAEPEPVVEAEPEL